MALQTASGTFQTGTGTTAVSVTGLAFQPLVVLFRAVGRGSTGQSASAQLGFGAATDSTHRWATTAAMENGVGTSVTNAVVIATACLQLLKVTGATVYGALDFTSMNSDGFTVTPTTAFTADTMVEYLALGGSSLTNAAVGTKAATTTTTNFSVTGLSFQPTLAVLSWCGAAQTTLGTIASPGKIGFGWASSSSARAAVAASSQNGVGTEFTQSIVTTTKCVSVPATSTHTIADECDFSSFNTDGFTLTHPTASGNAFQIGWVALAGLSLASGTTTAQASTGNFTVTGLAFQPSALLLMAFPTQTATMTVPAASNNVSYGWGVDSTHRSSVWVADDSGVATSASQQRADTTRILMDYNVTSPFAIVGDVDLVSLDAAGFTLNQTTADANVGLIPYLALGPAAGAAKLVPVRLLLGEAEG